MIRFNRLGSALVLSLATALSGCGQSTPTPASPTAPKPAGVVLSDPVPAEAKKVPTLHNGLPLVPAPEDDELRRLLIARYNTALGELKSVTVAFEHGIATTGSMSRPVERLCRVGLELSDNPADQIAILERLLASAKQDEARVKVMYDAKIFGGEAGKMHRATYLRLDAEIELLRAKRKAGLAK